MYVSLDAGMMDFMAVVAMLSGGMILLMDVNAYKRLQWNKEKKFARVLGWGNIALGAVVLTGAIIYQQFRY